MRLKIMLILTLATIISASFLIYYMYSYFHELRNVQIDKEYGISSQMYVSLFTIPATCHDEAAVWWGGSANETTCTNAYTSDNMTQVLSLEQSNDTKFVEWASAISGNENLANQYLSFDLTILTVTLVDAVLIVGYYKAMRKYGGL